MKKKYRALIVIAVILAVLGLTISYLKAITGTIVDAETGKPIEGAVVLVEWTKQIGIGDYHTESMWVVETATDRAGKFIALGPFHPFVDPVDVTVYKKGYVAWNNQFIFPDYKHRQYSENMYQKIVLEKFKETYSYYDHTRFLGTCSADAFASYKKRKFAAAYEWERDLSRQEVLRKK